MNGVLWTRTSSYYTLSRESGSFMVSGTAPFDIGHCFILSPRPRPGRPRLNDEHGFPSRGTITCARVDRPSQPAVIDLDDLWFAVSPRPTPTMISPLFPAEVTWQRARLRFPLTYASTTSICPAHSCPLPAKVNPPCKMADSSSNTSQCTASAFP